MTLEIDEPVISGMPYTINEVDGRPPTGLAGCLGERTLTLVRSGLAHQVHGTGTNRPDGVRVYQKDLGLDRKDVRAWTITDLGDDVLLAQRCPASEPLAARPGSVQHQTTG